MTDTGVSALLPAWPPQSGPFLWIAIAVVAAGLAGELVLRRLGLPRITGYFLVGFAYSLLGFDLDAARLAGDLRIVFDLALAVLLFELGCRVNLKWLRANHWLLATSIAESTAAFLAALAVLLWAGIGTATALSVSIILLSTSPAIVMRVVSEFRADGQLTERLILLSALNTVYSALGAKLMLGWLHHSTGGTVATALGLPLYVVAGSAAFGFLLAWAIRWVMRNIDLADDNAVLALLGMLMLALVLVDIARLSPLLTPLIAGLVLRNLWSRPVVFPRHFGTAGGVLVAMLFLATGMAVSLAQFATGGAIALLLVVARSIAKLAATAALGVPSGLNMRQGIALGIALAPASGVALALAADLRAVTPELASDAGAIAFSAIVILELLGPLAVHWALKRCDETHV